jgi:hypothetical protein
VGALAFAAAAIAAFPAPAAAAPQLGISALDQEILHAIHMPAELHLRKHAKVTAAGHALPPSGVPSKVRRIFEAGNRIALTPYVWGGGHGSWKAAGYDCSGSVGYALHAAHLLKTATTSGAFESYGRPGPGRWVTIYANGGHVYMTVAGLRFDTSSHGVGGSRWTRAARDSAGYVVRHPAGL